MVLLGSSETVREGVRDVIVRGKRLSVTTLDARGVVIQYPATIHQQMSVAFGQPLSADICAAARMARSEGAAAAEARVHVALNDLRKLGWSSLFSLITYSTASWARGSYGKQFSVDPETGAKQKRRYASTRDAYESDVQRAIHAIADHEAGNDPTGGAVKFVDRSSFGVQAGTGSFEALKARWEADGLVAYSLPQYGDDLVFFRRA